MQYLIKHKAALVLALALILSVFLVVPSVIAAQSANLVYNGDFSNGNTGWNWHSLAGTELCCAGGYPPGAYPEAFAHPDGTGGYITSWQNISDIQAGVYTLSGWIKTSGGVQSAWLQTDNGTFEERYCQTTPTNASSWQQFSCSFTLSSPATVHVAMVASNALETAWGWIAWDSISLVRENLVTNGDFSNGTDGWTWTPNLSGVEPCRYVYLPLVIKSSGAAFEANRETSRALSSTANYSPVACPQAYAHPNGAGNYIVPWQDIPNPLTGTYTLAGWILTSGGLQSAWIQADNGDFNTRHCQSTPTNTSSWQQFGCSFSLNAPGTLHVALVASNASETTGGWVKWDSISLIRQSGASTSTYDLAQYMGRTDGINGPVYQFSTGETMQVQYASNVWQGKPGFYQVKNTNWEELGYDATSIRRLRDTSLNETQWYGLYAGCPGACSLGAVWAPRYMGIGDRYWRDDTTVKVYTKTTCLEASTASQQSGTGHWRKATLTI